VESARREIYAFLLAKIGNKVDRAEWNTTPPTVNAFYDPTQNAIIFPAGILQSPFFQFDADDAANYGAIGALNSRLARHASRTNSIRSTLAAACATTANW
jgi:putative endopeptidase